jgi:hypothetical protein
VAASQEPRGSNRFTSYDTQGKEIPMNARSLLLTVAVFALRAPSQSVPNGSFEDWATVMGFEEPTGGWFTTNGATQSYPTYGVLKTTDAADGQYAAKLVTGRVSVPEFGMEDTTALVATGSVADGTGMPAFGFSFTDRPEAFRFMYKYEPQAPVGQDTARVYFELRRWNAGAGTSDRIAEAWLNIAEPVAAYTQVQLPVQYLLPDTPDTAYIEITSSLSGFSVHTEPYQTALMGNTLYIDKIELGPLTDVAPDRRGTARPPATVFLGAVRRSLVDLRGRTLDGATRKPGGSAGGLYVVHLQTEDGRSLGGHIAVHLPQ